MASIQALFSTILDTARHMYGDYQDCHSPGPNSLKIMIHYPSVQIYNERGQNRNLRDLYVYLKIQVDRNILSMSRLEGARMTFSEIELYNGYAHSHLRRRDAIGKFASFCRGEAFNTLFPKQLEQVQVEEMEAYAFSLFTVLNQYVCTESLAGTPYFYMSDIEHPGNSTPPARLNTRDKLQLDTLFGAHADVRAAMSFTLVEGHPVFTFDRAMEEALLPYCPDAHRCVRARNGYEYIPGETLSVDDVWRQARSNMIHFTFRGREVEPTFYREEEQEEIELTNVSNAIRQYVTETINEKLQQRFYERISSRRREAWQAYCAFRAQGA